MIRIRKPRKSTLAETTKSVSFGEPRRCMKIQATSSAFVTATASATGVFQTPRCWNAAQTVSAVRIISAAKTARYAPIPEPCAGIVAHSVCLPSR